MPVYFRMGSLRRNLRVTRLDLNVGNLPTIPFPFSGFSPEVKSFHNVTFRGEAVPDAATQPDPRRLLEVSFDGP